MYLREITYRTAITEAIQEEMSSNPDVFMMGEDIGVYGGAFGVTKGLLEEFGSDRVRDTPISELGMTGVAVGAALTGMRPIVDIQFSDFITLAADQIVNQAAKIRYMYGGKGRVPLVIRTPGGAGTGAAAQHSQSLEAWMTHIPGLKVVQPTTAYDAKGLMKSAIRDDNPVLFYEHKLLYSTTSSVPIEDYNIPLGVADVKRVGNHVTVVATGKMVDTSLEAAKRLAEAGVEIEVIDPRTLVPLDHQTIIKSLQKTNHLVVVHEAVKRGGFGAEIASVIAEEAFHHLHAPIKRLGGEPVPIPNNKQLEAASIPEEQDIIEAVLDIRHLPAR